MKLSGKLLGPLIFLLGCGEPRRDGYYSAILKITITGVECGNVEVQTNNSVFNFTTTTTTFPPPGHVRIIAKPVEGFVPTTKEIALEVEEAKSYEVAIVYEQKATELGTNPC